MNRSENIMPELVDKISNAITEGKFWMAHNTLSSIERGEEIYFFKDKEEATMFSGDNISDYDSFAVTHVTSVKQAIEKVWHNQFSD